MQRTPSALFVLSLQGGRAIIGGADTTADVMLTLAGAKNAASSLKGFKPISEELIIAMDPEAIVLMSRSGGHGVGSEVLTAPWCRGDARRAATGASSRWTGSI